MRDAALSIAKLYADTVYDCTPLPGGHNKVFAVKGDRDFILRLKKDRSDQDPAFGPGNVFGTVSSELDFMLYLKENGAPVAEPIAGKSGEYVYRRRYRNGDWIVSAFRLAPGKGFSDRFDGPEKLVQAGKALGLMHRLSKSYVPRGASSRRQWHLDPHLVKAPFLFSGFDNRLPEAFHRHMNQISRLNKSQDAFGLTHGDYLFSNYFFKEDEITVFDFDECAYSWFISDIAVCLYYYLIGAEPEKLSLRQKEAAAYFTCLIRGYRTENALELEQVKSIDLFFKLRDYILLSTNLETRKYGFNGWQQQLIEGILDRVLNERPFIRVDFEALYLDA